MILAGLDAATIVGISVYFSNEISSLKDEIKKLDTSTDINNMNDKIVALGSFVKEEAKPQNYREINRQLQNHNNNINILNDKVNKLEQVLNVIFMALKNAGLIKIENNREDLINNEIKKSEVEKIDDIDDFLSEI